MIFPHPFHTVGAPLSVCEIVGMHGSWRIAAGGATTVRRVVAVLALAKGDFVFDAMPVLEDSMLEFHCLSDAIQKRALAAHARPPRP